MIEKLLIFDIDGTLTNTTLVDDECYKGAFLEVFDIDLTHQAWHLLQNVTDAGIMDEILSIQERSLDDVSKKSAFKQRFIGYLEARFQSHPHYFKEIPGASSFLGQLLAKGNPIAIATGSWLASAKIKLKSLGLDLDSVPLSHCDNLISREAITKEAIKMAKAHYQTEFREVIYFGDGEWDFKTCKNLGIDFVGIDVADSGRLAAMGADKVYPDYMGSQNIIDAL